MSGGLARQIRACTLAMVVAVAVPPVAHAHPTDESGTYRWVTPPVTRRPDNVPPEAREFTFPGGTFLREFYTTDLQLTVVWHEGALGPSDVVMSVTPLDPSDLGGLPPTHEPNGNAYLLELDPIDRFAGPATVILALPASGATIFHSRDGRAWTPLQPEAAEPGKAIAAITAEGYVLAAKPADSSPSAVDARVVGALGAGLVVTAVVVLRAQRRRRPPRTSVVP